MMKGRHSKVGTRAPQRALSKKRPRKKKRVTRIWNQKGEKASGHHYHNTETKSRKNEGHESPGPRKNSVKEETLISKKRENCKNQQRRSIGENVL